RDDNDVLDSGRGAFLDGVLDERLVDNRQHFLWLRLRGRQETSAKACRGEDGCADAMGFACHHSSLKKIRASTYVERRKLSMRWIAGSLWSVRSLVVRESERLVFLGSNRCAATHAT